MKEYEYTIIRRESRNPKRHRQSRGVSQSDLEAIKNELEGNNKDTDLIISDIRDSISDLDSLSVSIEDLTSSATDIKKRLAGAEGAISSKLDSGDFSKWKAGDLAKLLAGKQNKGNYVDPSELVTSQQQTLAEAVKQAGELDKQIKVGGRNLLRDSGREAISKDKYMIAEYALADLGEIVEGETYHVKVWATVEGEDSDIQVYNSGHPPLARIPIINGVAEATFKWKNWYSGGIPRVGPLCIYRRSGFDGNTDTTITIHKVKLERGPISTDWTPAPEDVAESVTALASELVSSQKKTLAEAVKQAGALDDKQAEEYKKLLAGKQAAGNYLSQEDFDKFKAGLKNSADDTAKEIADIKSNYKVVVSKRGEIRNGKVYDGVDNNGSKAILHTAQIYTLFGEDATVSQGDNLTWTVNKGRTTAPLERTVTGVACYVTEADFVYNQFDLHHYDIQLESNFKAPSNP